MNEEWQAALEEFGDMAFCRFEQKQSNLTFYASSNISVEIDTLNWSLRPLSDLFAHDVDIYGENAYLKWEFKYFVTGQWTDCTSNHTAELLINDWLNPNCWLGDKKQEIRRKK